MSVRIMIWIIPVIWSIVQTRTRCLMTTMISCSFIDRFILDAPNGETYYFRDYEGAEDFWMLNLKDVNLDED